MNRLTSKSARTDGSNHEHVFFKDDGEPIHHLHYGWKRWRRSLERINLRPRPPYKARHSFITWNLMLGKNPLWVAKQHGHSAHLPFGTKLAPARSG